MESKRPITIKEGAYRCSLYDVGNFLHMPLKNTRKLWEIMFFNFWEDENKQSIAVIQNWAASIVTEAKTRLQTAENRLKEAENDEEAARSALTVFGSAPTKEQKEAHKNAKKCVRKAKSAVTAAKTEQVKAIKLQAVFYGMAQKHAA